MKISVRVNILLDTLIALVQVTIQMGLRSRNLISFFPGCLIACTYGLRKQLELYSTPNWLESMDDLNKSDISAHLKRYTVYLQQ